MVLSHALIAPLDEVVVASNLGDFFDQLISVPEAPSSLATLNLSPSETVPSTTQELRAVASALCARHSGPVVRLGHEGFESLVAALWGRIEPSLRRGLSFRLSFSPRDIVDTPPPALVCTPPSLSTRWQGHLLAESFRSTTPSPAVTMLSGSEGNHPLRTFANSLGTELTSFGDLALLEQAYRFAVVQPNVIDNTIAAVRLIGRLSPDPKFGDSAKRELIKRLNLQLETARGADVLALRNLVMTAFGEPTSLWSSLSRWLERNSFPVRQDDAFRSIVSDGMGNEAAQEWRSAVIGGLVKAAETRNGAFEKAFWRWVEEAPELATALWKAVGAVAGLEECLVRFAPAKLRQKAGQAIAEFVLEEGLYQLHAAIVSAIFSPGEAVRVHLKVVPASLTDTIPVVLRNASDHDVLVCATELMDRRLVELAAEAVSRAPNLLVAFDLSTDVVRTIWSSALERNLEAWRGPADPRAAFEGILLDLLGGRKVASELLDRLSRTPLADLSEFSRQPEVWSKVNSSTRDNFLRETARGWLDKIASGLPVPGLDAQIQTAILHDQRLDQLLNQSDATDRFDRAVRILTNLPMYPENRFTSWLRSALDGARVEASASAALGRLIEQRRWRSAADEMMRMLRWSGRQDLRPALRECASMVGIFDRWVYGLSPISQMEKWEALEHLSADLYPSGPDDEGVWERAGGYNADLPWGSSGRSRWRDALAQIRRGGKGPKIGSLLREMQRDFPGNSSLRLLAEERDFSRY
ncbi:hypothetical protein J6524_09850 [Bradyrhizobium sp. WSM 1738]|nr:hypothetical protein [Bradyrhizobium hereditatis]